MPTCAAWSASRSSDAAWCFTSAGRFRSLGPLLNVVVTGSRTGIGRGLAERLLSRGDHVWGLARSEQTEFAARHPGRFQFSPCDVAHWSNLEKASAEIAKAWP